MINPPASGSTSVAKRTFSQQDACPSEPAGQNGTQRLLLWPNTSTAIQKLPTSLSICPKEKRRRRKFSDLDLSYTCIVEGCDKKFALLNSLQQHLKQRHDIDTRVGKGSKRRDEACIEASRRLLQRTTIPNRACNSTVPSTTLHPTKYRRCETREVKNEMDWRNELQEVGQDISGQLFNTSLGPNISYAYPPYTPPDVKLSPQTPPVAFQPTNSMNNVGLNNVAQNPLSEADLCEFLNTLNSFSAPAVLSKAPLCTRIHKPVNGDFGEIVAELRSLIFAP